MVLRTSSEKQVGVGEAVLRVGDPSIHWLGIVHGLLHMYLLNDQGRESTLACIAQSEWCGEGSLIKGERRRYDAIAMEPSRIALVPLATFTTLRDESIAFNQYLQTIMNERMSGFIALLTAHRFLSVEQRVAHCVAMLGAKQVSGNGLLTLGQQQIALLCGLSRQRVNAALGALEHRGLVNTTPKGLLILDLKALQAYGAPGDRDTTLTNK
ncbi:MAG: Crp/Fnr family transcriptional regulator [Ramlibacter sp.]